MKFQIINNMIMLSGGKEFDLITPPSSTLPLGCFGLADFIL